MKTLLLGTAAALTLAAMNPAGAADVPVAPAYKALPVVSSGAFYIWADGSAQEVNLPTVGLGLKATATTSPFFDQGAVSTFNPRVDGWGTRGAIGYILPPGTLPSGFGANVRIEVGASYVKASDTESDGRLITNNALTVQNLNGALSSPNAFICFGVTFNCTAGSSLANDFSTWDVYGKVASDVQIGPLTMTRSWAVFGGQGRSNQTLNQTFNRFTATGVSVAGQRVMESISRFITQKLKLKVNEAKSAVARPQERKFLGFSFTAGPDIKRTIAPKSLERFKRRIREITRRARGVSIKTTVEELATYMRGWRGYFGFCETPEVLVALTRWVRLRLRAALWRQWKTPRRRRATLTALRISGQLLNTASSGRGPWPIARSKALCFGLSNAYFKSLGLPSLFGAC